MPIYEFKCPSCGYEFEELVSSHAAAQQMHCIRCGATNAERKISLFGFTCQGAHGETRHTASSSHSCSGCATHHCSRCH